MNSNKRRNPIKRSDYCRVLVTETLPYETPLIFSNDGLYERVTGVDKAGAAQQLLSRTLVFGVGEGKVNSTIPYLYKIRKNSSEFRRLALVHPRSQWKIKEFYEKYEHLILYHCAHSPASIRAPQKIAGSFFFKSSIENLNQYKTGSISLLKLDELTKHSPSFFTYRGYDRLYKLFESPDYFALEKRYAYMRTLDVAKCFDSIYTHSMSWALKDKEFTKRHVGVDATFAQQFDALMRHANHNETSGIVIGPEVSRIFAEAIFQEIDLRVISRLHKKRKSAQSAKLTFGNQYCFRRYVDDVFIFGETPKVTKLIYETYADVLMSFNLHANTSKSVETVRPFITNKSRLIQEASNEVNKFVERFLQAGENAKILVPRDIRSTWRLTRRFIESIRALCSYNQVNYDEVAGYLIAVCTERVKKLVAIENLANPETDLKRYRDASFVLLDVLYFLYQVSPSVGASYKLCSSIILLVRFTRKHLPDLEATVAQRIFELTEKLLGEPAENDSTAVEGFLHLEFLNIVLALRELGPNYLLPAPIVEALFLTGRESSYFTIVCCLFYVRDEACYADVRKAMLGAADAMLEDLSDIRMNSEKAYLLLDLLGCPYAPLKKKRAWLIRAFKALGGGTPSSIEISAFLLAAETVHVHVNWGDVDLLSSLEKKELKKAY